MRLVSVCQKPAVDNFEETPHPTTCFESRIWNTARCAFASLAGRRPGSDAKHRRARRLRTTSNSRDAQTVKSQKKINFLLICGHRVLDFYFLSNYSLP
jgi:hypothetical protein